MSHSTRSPTPSAPEEGRRTEDDEPRRRDERRREGTRRETKSDEGDTTRATGNIIIKTTYDISLDFQDSLLPLGFLSLSRVRSSSSPRSGSGTEGEKDERLTDGDRSGEVRGEKGKGVTRRDPMHSALMSFATVSRPFHSLLHRYACYARHSLLPSFVPHARAAASVRRVRDEERRKGQTSVGSSVAKSLSRTEVTRHLLVSPPHPRFSSRSHRFSALLSVHPVGAGEAGGNWNRDHREEPEPEGWKEQRTEGQTRNGRG